MNDDRLRSGSLHARDFSGFHALRANVDLLDASIDVGSHLLDVGTKRPVGHPMRVTDIAPCSRRLIAYDTYLGHAIHSLLVVCASR